MEVLVVCVCVWCHSLHVLLISQDLCISANIQLKMAPEICLFALCNSACVWMPTSRKKTELPAVCCDVWNKTIFQQIRIFHLTIKTNHISTQQIRIFCFWITRHRYGWRLEGCAFIILADLPCCANRYSVTSRAFISSVVLTLCCVRATEGNPKAVTFANWINFTL